MVSTTRMARSRTLNFRGETSHRNYQNTGNALFTGPFCYTNLCIKNVALIDFAKDTGEFLSDSLE